MFFFIDLIFCRPLQLIEVAIYVTGNNSFWRIAYPNLKLSAWRVYNEESSFKGYLILDLPLQGQCLHQIASSCHKYLKSFSPAFAISWKAQRLYFKGKTMWHQLDGSREWARYVHVINTRGIIDIHDDGLRVGCLHEQMSGICSFYLFRDK